MISNHLTMFVFLLLTLISSVTAKSIVIAKANDTRLIPTLPFPNSVFQHKVRGIQTDQTFVIFDAEYLNEGPGYHLHTKDDELFHILDGKVQFIVNGTQFCASTGDYVYVPRDISQGIRVYNPTNSSKRVKIQIMLLPSGLDNFLDEIAVIFNEDRNNQTAIDLISKKYGIIDLGPVIWEDLDCFNNISIQISSSVSVLIFVFLLKYIL
jgi:mannose-6-phosphate isomerase-like protein (cupin superfamily)